MSSEHRAVKNKMPSIPFPMWFMRESGLLRLKLEKNQELSMRDKQFMHAVEILLGIQEQDENGGKKIRNKSFKFKRGIETITVKAKTIDEAKELYFTTFPNVLPVDVLVNGERIQ